MSVQKLHVYIVLTIVAGLWSHAWSDTTLSAGETAKTWTFDSDNALTGWVIDGNVKIDSSRTRQGTGGALKVGPGGKAVLRFRDEDESGRVDVWVYDDSTVPEDAKVRRVGPRWGLVQSDGNVLAIGALYAVRRPAGTSGPSTSIPRWDCKCCTTTRRSRRSTHAKRA